MKVAFINSGMNQGGSQRAIAGLSNAMCKKGIEVSIITLQAEESFYKFDDRVAYLPLGVAKESSSFFDAVKNNLKAVMVLRENLAKVGVDALIGMNPSSITYSVLASIFLKTKVIGYENSNPYILPISKVWRFIRDKTAPFVSGYIFQTDRARTYFSKYVQKKGTVIPNAIYNEDVNSITLPVSREKIISAVGRLSAEKGFDVLIKAFYKVHNELPEYRLFIYGEGPEREALQELINKHELTGRVVLPGAITNVVHEINKTSLFVLSSRFEGMPNALMEAMACGLPCIATDCEMGPAELIKDGVNGLLVKVDDVDIMAETIKRVLNSPELAARLSSNAINIRNTHSIGAIVTELLKYLEEVLRR